MLSYDFNRSEATRAVYLKPSEPLSLPEGTGIIGMWVWGDGCGHWLRATVADETGSRSPIDFPRIHWTGWRYVQASLPAELVGPAWLTQVYLVEFKPEMQGAGTVYIDSIAAIGVSTPDIAEDGSSPPESSSEMPSPPPPLASLSASPRAATAARTDRPQAPRPLEPGENLASLVRSAPGRHVISVDGSRPSLPWPWLVQEFNAFKAGDDVELVVVLSRATAVDATSLTPGGTFKDSLQARLLLDLLDTLADGSTSIILVQDPRPGSLPAQGSGAKAEPGELYMPDTGPQTAPVWTMMGHVKVVWNL
jgi:hypothetical protein